MIEARLSELAASLDTRLIKGDAAFVGVSTDSRAVKPGELFVALRGERFDAHDYVAQAQAAGAAAAVVERELTLELPQLVCLDTLEALGRIARLWRERTHARVVGITGSNGKTTVKTLAASILARGFRCHVNAGNLNNEIGLPISLLRMPAHTEVAVLEMGAGKPGDIAYLADIARPDIGLVNNVAAAHLARMGTLDGVAETKGAIYSALPPDGVAIVNADCAYAERFVRLAGSRRIVRYALDRSADVTARIRTLGASTRFELIVGAGTLDVDLPLPGRHNVRNALAAAALALAAGASLAAIKSGLEQVQGVAGRLTRHALPSGATLIDDSYNANPGSVRAAIDTLALEPGERWLVLGNMAELGAGAEQLHAEAGAYARAIGIDRLVTVGTLAARASEGFGTNAEHHATHDGAIESLRAHLPGAATVLVKGSRSSTMEKVVNALIGRSNGGTAHAA
ncbi:MAG TPA: UDP-N-acetylmuramoyl-tripeptide--D-alanyl-D-alanine ligase [Candidatus Saccharimonadia bacterium]|nr:UDP-N-acetylmuramoyl-tripeptide--D-alanyl-D-alanine ligase [Candidatus Saccharimonadia bacterium]